MLFLVCAGAISDIVWLVYFPVRLHRAELWTHSVLKNLSDPTAPDPKTTCQPHRVYGARGPKHTCTARGRGEPGSRLIKSNLRKSLCGLASRNVEQN